MKLLAKIGIGLAAAGAAYNLVRRRRSAMPPVEIHGFVNPQFEAVGEAFAENFAKRRETRLSRRTFSERRRVRCDV